MHSTNNRPDCEEIGAARNAVATIIRHATTDPVYQHAQGGKAQRILPICLAGAGRLLGADRIGVALSEEWQLEPEQSTSAIVVLNPHAKYFTV